jgi:hypothetical protein
MVSEVIAAGKTNRNSIGGKPKWDDDRILAVTG